jgi:hypothetical protein
MKLFRLLSAAILSTGVALTSFAEPKSSSGDNLLQNGSFEEVSPGTTDQAAHWLRWGQWLNREDSWSPTHSGKALIGYHHWQINSSDDSGMWQDIKVTPGKTYEFTLYVLQDPAGDKADADSFEVRLESVEGDHTVAINSMSAKVADLESGKQWSKLTVSGTAPSATLRALIRIVPAKNGPRGGAVKCDDAELHLK